ncbi:MAG TPA: hypothetical protein VN520_16215 [Streptomyces sp.]|uniref:hypothetical protein n=1 Tax=Streptomyces sp. TaxID=1931 RepID=UPI002B621956|nr:hypothetical protein [Streptomyces sp.]HWU07901.1 hypothetical protein [Streptomyces sp.]
MADGANTDGQDQGRETVELRISLTGTHTRRDDLQALHTWLKKAPVIEDALKRNELGLQRKDSFTQVEAMGGELIQDIILVVSVELARSVAENAWRSVETWLRNRRRFADPDEAPRVTLEGPTEGPGSDLRRDTGPGSEPGAGSGPGSASGPGPGFEPGPGRGRGPDAGSGSRGDDRAGGGDEPGEV